MKNMTSHYLEEAKMAALLIIRLLQVDFDSDVVMMPVLDKFGIKVLSGIFESFMRDIDMATRNIEAVDDEIDMDPWIIRSNDREGLKSYMETILNQGEKTIPINYMIFRTYIFDYFNDDKDIVIEAVNSGWRPLELASEKICDSKEVVLSAVKKSGMELVYASSRLQMDKELVIEAVRNDPGAIKYTTLELQRDDDVLSAAGYI